MGVNEYFSHRLYVDVTFRTLIGCLGEFLAERHWVVSGSSLGFDIEYQTLRKPPEINIIPGNRSKRSLPEANILSAPARQIAEDSGFFLFRVVHLRWGWEKGIISPFQVKVARKQFEQCPNYIEIETHRKWYGGQKEIAKQVSNFIEEKGINTYIRSYEDEFLDVLETAYDNLDEKADALHQLTQSTIPWKDIPELTAKILPFGFVLIIPCLHDQTIRFLRTAEHLRNIVGVLPDNSPAIVEYCKSVEWELHTKVFGPIIANTPKDINSRPNGNLKRVWEGLGKPRELTLGEMKDCILSALDSENDNNRIAAAVRASLFGAAFGSWLHSPFIWQLENLIKFYRNAAAHKSVMSLADVERTRFFVLGDADHSGLLELICEG
jgi:hypothetical protein